MYDAHALESINHEQLVTTTDRMLLRGVAPKRRASSPSLPPELAPYTRFARSSHPHISATEMMRAARSRAPLHALAVVVPVLGLAAGLAALL